MTKKRFLEKRVRVRNKCELITEGNTARVYRLTEAGYLEQDRISSELTWLKKGYR